MLASWIFDRYVELTHQQCGSLSVSSRTPDYWFLHVDRPLGVSHPASSFHLFLAEVTVLFFAVNNEERAAVSRGTERRHASLSGEPAAL